MKKVMSLTFVVLFYNCNQESYKCDFVETESLFLPYVNATIGIPTKKFILTDTSVFSNEKNSKVWSYENPDKVSQILIDIRPIGKLHEETKTIEGQKYRISSMLPFIRKSYKEFLDTIYLQKKVEIGYLKYNTTLKDSITNTIDSYIFFYRNGELIVIEIIENNSKNKISEPKIADCIFSSLKLN